MAQHVADEDAPSRGILLAARKVFEVVLQVRKIVDVDGHAGVRLELESVMREHMHDRWGGVERSPGDQQHGHYVMPGRVLGSNHPSHGE